MILEQLESSLWLVERISFDQAVSKELLACTLGFRSRPELLQNEYHFDRTMNFKVFTRLERK